MASFTDWLARTFYITAEQEQTSAEVAAAQQSILDRQLKENKVSGLKYYQLSNEIQDTGAQFFDEQLGKSGTAGLPGLAFHYWWLWALIGGAALFYFWPVLRPLFNRLTKK